jgi:hypothetical protein
MLAFDITSLPWGWILAGIISFGTAIGLIIAYFASREYVQRTIQVLKDTIESQERQLVAEKKLAATLAESHATAIALSEEKLAAMTKERNNYRDTLHTTRETMQATQLQLQELQLRPDLNQVLIKEEAWHARREEFYTVMAANQRAIIDTQRETLRIIGNIKTNVEEELKQSTEVCAQVGKALQDVLSGFADRDSILIEIRDLLKNPRSTAESEPPPQNSDQ